MKSEAILVVGATGTVGSELVRLLKADSRNVRIATSRKPGPGQVSLNLLTGEGLTAAFEGIDRAFFLSPGGYATHDKILLPLIQEAKRRGLKKVVLMTALGANANEQAPMRIAEVALEKSGLNYNIIRPNWFMQNFKGFVQNGKIQLPAGTAKVSFIDTRDISAVAARLLTHDELNNRAFDLTGPEAINHADVAETISAATGKSVTYSEISPTAMRENLRKAGTRDDYADFLIMILGFLREGYNAAVNANVETILGRKPHDLKTFASDFRNEFNSNAFDL